MKAADLGGLVVAVVLLAKTGFFKELIAPPETPPGNGDNDGLGLRDISFEAWREIYDPGGSRLDYEDFLRGN